MPREGVGIKPWQHESLRRVGGFEGENILNNHIVMDLEVHLMLSVQQLFVFFPWLLLNLVSAEV